MKRLSRHFQATEAVVQATIEPPAPAPTNDPKVTLTAKKRPQLNVLQPATLEILEKAARAGMKPAFECNICMIGTDCPEYQKGSVCSVDKHFKQFDTRKIDDLVAISHDILSNNYLRLQRARFQEERVGGGLVDPNVTRLSKDVMEQLLTTINLNQQGQDELELTAEASGAEGGGILAKIFGRNRQTDDIELNPPQLPEPNPVIEPMVNEPGEDAGDHARVVVLEKDALLPREER